MYRAVYYLFYYHEDNEGRRIERFVEEGDCLRFMNLLNIEH